MNLFIVRLKRLITMDAFVHNLIAPLLTLLLGVWHQHAKSRAQLRFVDAHRWIARHTSPITCHASHITHHTCLITYHTSHITHASSHITHHTSHITHASSHITHHTCIINCVQISSCVAVLGFKAQAVALKGFLSSQHPYPSYQAFDFSSHASHLPHCHSGGSLPCVLAKAA